MIAVTGCVRATNITPFMQRKGTDNAPRLVGFDVEACGGQPRHKWMKKLGTDSQPRKIHRPSVGLFVW